MDSCLLTAAPPERKQSGSTDTAKRRPQVKQDSSKGDRSLKRKRPSQPVMPTSSAIKGAFHLALMALLCTCTNPLQEASIAA